MKKSSILTILLIISTFVIVSCGNQQGQNGGNSGQAAGEATVSPSSQDAAAPLAATTGKPGSKATPDPEAVKKAAEEKAKSDAEAAEAKRLRELKVDAPVAKPASGLTKGAVSVELTCPTGEARLTYTTDGSDPVAGKGKEYSGPIAISTSTVLKVLAWVPKGNKAAIQSFDYTIDEICVNGGASGDGTRTRPLGSLSKAVETAKALGINTIKIGMSPLTESLEVTDGLAFLGAWDAGFAKRTNKRSVIQGVAMAGSGKKTPGYGFKLTGTKVNDGRFENLELRAGASDYSAGLFVTEKAAPTFIACAFVGGSGSYGYGALVIGGAWPSFQSCILSGGAGSSGYGISVDSAKATMVSSAATAGDGTVTGAGAMVTDGQILAYNSLLAANGANTGYGLALYNSKGSKIESCTLWGGSGRDATALFISAADPSVSSTILAAKGKKISYGIHDNYGESAPSLLKNIAFVGCTGALYFDVDTKTYYTGLDEKGAFTSSAGKTLAKPLAANSALVAMELGSAPLCKTPADAPDFVVTGGLAPSVGTSDVANNKRTEPWTIGAWEVDR